MSDDGRAFWNEIRRSFVTAVNALTKARPNDRFTIEVRIVERRSAQQ